MDQERFKTIVSLLEQGELTLRENRFLEGVKKYFFEHRNLTEQQWSILEGVYREKIWMRKTFLSQDDLSKGSSSRAARNVSCRKANGFSSGSS
jgi:hypothetical protein